MDRHADNVQRIFPPRLLTDGEREILLGWIGAAADFTAFVSERRSDDPAIYRRIVVCRRVDNRRLYLIHSHRNSDHWIMVSAADGDEVGRFPTLRAALNCISPVTVSARPAGASSDDEDLAIRRERALRDAQSTIRHLQIRLDAAVQDLQTARAELAAERRARDKAEHTARAALNAVSEWRLAGGNGRYSSWLGTHGRGHRPGMTKRSVPPPRTTRLKLCAGWYQALQTGICTRHESVRRGRPCSGPVRSGITELPRPCNGRSGDSGRPGRRTRGGTGQCAPPERRRLCRLGYGIRNVPWCRRYSVGNRLPRQQQGHCLGCRSRWDLTDAAWRDIGVFPP